MASYDVFISYRRDTGRDIARPIKLELEKHGYNVFLDFDELKDGSFSQKIKDAISSAPIFIVILSPHALDRCINHDDWVRQEIEYAIIKKRHIIPINPDLSFEGFPENLPDNIKKELGLHQYSDILFGQLFEESVRKMVRERIVPYVQTPRKHKRNIMLIAGTLLSIILLFFGVFCSKIRSDKTDISDLTHFIVKGVEFEMVFVEGGSFLMGSDSLYYGVGKDEMPAHFVKVGNYYIGKYEITQKQWKVIMNGNPSHYQGDDNLPVENINFYDAVAFIHNLNDLTGLEFDFPTEAEWEYAAKGGKHRDSYVFSGSNNAEDVAWYKNNSGGRPKRVGQKKANSLGIYDMSGNVWEWCRDYYDSTYYQHIVDTIDPQGSVLSAYRNLRGGSVQLESVYCRNSNREGYDPSARDSDYGLRIKIKVN